MTSLQPPSGPSRSASSSSRISASSAHESRASSSSSGQALAQSPTETRSGTADNVTPQPQHPSQQTSHPYLPAMTSSPPPHAPAYVPPPQHAMAPDPIHGSQWRSGPGNYVPPIGRNLANGHDSYASRSSGSSAPNPAIFQHPAFQSSSRPDSRAARSRERSVGGDGDRDSREDEVISTIFVVGFPDDMLEREFQNIFTFSAGFEAATLKFPSGSRNREPAALLLAELQSIQASQQAAQASGEVIDLSMQAPLEEAIAALSMAGTANTSASTTPSAAVSLTPSAPSGPTFGGPTPPQVSSRRQTIGFARFKTRADALAAKEHLQGRKIDPLTGSTLKAEMAKKNLHTKRTNPGDELVGMLLRSSRLSGLVNPAPQAGTPAPSSLSSAPARDAWEWQNADKADDKYNYYGGSYGGSVPVTAPLAQTQANYTSSQSNASGSPPLSVKSPNQRPSDSKALLALAEEADELEGWTVDGAVGMGMDGFSSSRTPASGAPPHQPRERSLSNAPPPSSVSNMPSHLQTGAPVGMYRQDGPYGSSPPGQGEHAVDASTRGLGLGVTGANPADQNPPINTLYVGNLPAISPPTHPPNYLEESLRALFVRCNGYKRMSFRQKINGPMCFVEFEDVSFAAQAIKDLYGHNLGGLVKGGIRLSYSKNSLGQRGNGHPSGAPPPSGYGGLIHGQGVGSLSPTTPTIQPGYSLQLQNVPGGPPQSAPVPMAGDLRRGSESTSLSPNAQPFNTSLPVTTSPRSRYFGSSPSKVDTYAYAASANAAQPIPTGPSQNGGPAASSAQFSPVSSPIRTPASYSWVSSGQANATAASMGNGGYSFDPFAGGGMSLSGAASTWQSGTNGTPMS